MAAYLPEEILIQILARLPVKSLLKFRSVCKSWYSLISGPDFINTHLNLNNNNTFLLFEHASAVISPDYHEYTLEMDTSGFIGFMVYGFCNGLLCLLNYKNTKIILWNPSIKKSVTLPTPKVTNRTRSVVGFGFDYRANDYKVVKVQYMRIGYPPEVELCELSKGTWRQITCTVPTKVISAYGSQAFINGIVHWIALDHKSILGFDMVDEVFHEMALPDEVAVVAPGYVLHISIGIFEESLMLVLYTSHFNNCCSVWVMKEYGIVKSWVNQFNVNLEVGFRIVQSLMKNVELSLETTSKRLILDQKLKFVEFHSGSIRSLCVGTYMESLVLFKGRQADSCDAVTSKRKEDGNEEQCCPTMLEEAKATKLRLE